MTEIVHPGQLDPRLSDLQRAQHSGFTAGLCRAVAERWRVDPLIVRLAVVALAFAGGVGVVLYCWGWLLTPREGDAGHPPVLRLLPAFGRWSMRTQAMVVGVSSLVVVLSLARQSGVAWGPVIVVAVLAWAVARKRRGAPGEPPTGDTYPPADASTAGAPGVDLPRGRGESIEQWRTRVGAHGGSPLPTVNLYAPAPRATATATATAPRPRPRTSWWAALALVSLTATGAALPLALGLRPALAWAFVAAAGTAAVLLLCWTLLVRRRRLPGAVLVLALLGAVGTALLAMNYSQASTSPLNIATGGAAHYSFVGEAPAKLDLSDLDVDTPATVTIDATASYVRLILPETPGTITVEGDTINFIDRSPRGAPTNDDLQLILDGDFSVVELEMAP